MLVQKIARAHKQVGGTRERVTSAKIDSFVTGVPDDSKTYTIGVLAFSGKRCIQIDESTAKHNRRVD